MLPFVVSAVALVVDVGAGSYPPADRALIELRTRDVGHHPVLVGLVSREGWSHPGPTVFYLLAAPYRLIGSASIGINLAALLINGSAVVGMALLARRRGGTRLLLLTLVGTAVLVRSLGADFMHDPWNPYLPVLPFGALLFLCWGMTCGEAWALPIAVAVASFCVQTHIGYAPLAIPVLAWATVWLIVRARRRGAPSPRVLGRAAAAGALVLVGLWAPPIVDQLGVSHNMGNVADYFANSDDQPNTVGDGYRAVAAQLARSPEWVTGVPPHSPFNGEPFYLDDGRVPVLLVPFGLAAVFLWRRRTPGALALIATLSLTLVLGVLAVARILGPVYEYRLRWTWVVAMMVALVAVWAATIAAPRRWAVAGTTVALAALTALAGANTVGAARAGVLHELESSALRRVTPSVMRALPVGDGDVIVRPTSFGSAIYSAGLVLQLERRGVTARVDPAEELSYGKWRVHRRGRVRSVLTVAADNNVEPVMARNDLELIAYWGTLTRARRASSIARLAELRLQHEARMLSDADYVARASRVPLGRALAVFRPKTP